MAMLNNQMVQNELEVATDSGFSQSWPFSIAMNQIAYPGIPINHTATQNGDLKSPRTKENTDVLMIYLFCP